MSDSQQGGAGYRSLLMGASFIVIVAGLKAAGGILLPVLVAAFLAVLSIPPINWLSSHRIPRWLATLTVFTVVLGGLVGVSIFVGASIGDFAANLPVYEASLAERTEGLFAWIDNQKWLADFNIEISKDSIVEKLDAGKVMGMFAEAVGAFTSMLSNTFFVLLTVIFILAEAAGLPAKLQVAFGSKGTDVSRYGKVLGDLQGYLLIKTGVSLITGLLAGTLCAIVGVDYPLLWGLVAFLLNYIPTLGSIIAAFPAVILALVQFGWSGR